MKKPIILLSILIAFLAFFNCDKNDSPEPLMPDINVIDISGESNWDYCVLGTEDYYFIKTNGSVPEGALFHSLKGGYDYSIFFMNYFVFKESNK